MIVVRTRDTRTQRRDYAIITHGMTQRVMVRACFAFARCVRGSRSMCVRKRAANILMRVPSIVICE